MKIIKNSCLFICKLVQEWRKKVRFWIIYAICTLIVFRPFIPEVLTKLSSIIKSNKGQEIYKQLEDIFGIFSLCPTYIKYSFFIIYLLFSFILIYAMFMYKPKFNATNELHVFLHSTMKKVRCELKSSQNYKVVIDREINKIDKFPEPCNRSFKALIIQEIEEQDNYVRQFRENCKENNIYTYMGISHTPLILRAGSMLGDGIAILPIHKNRNEDFYRVLSNDKIYPKLNVKKAVVEAISDELIVAVSTSFLIEDYQLESFIPQSKHVIKFESTKLGVDIIQSNEQLEEYIKIILEELRSIVREKNIKTIHICISSSAIFTFVLGQRLSKTYDREIIIYHYQYIKSKDDKSKTLYYPWGIKLFEDSKTCIVKN